MYVFWNIFIRHPEIIIFSLRIIFMDYKTFFPHTCTFTKKLYLSREISAVNLMAIAYGSDYKLYLSRKFSLVPLQSYRYKIIQISYIFKDNKVITIKLSLAKNIRLKILLQRFILSIIYDPIQIDKSDDLLFPSERSSPFITFLCLKHIWGGYFITNLIHDRQRFLIFSTCT